MLSLFIPLSDIKIILSGIIFLYRAEFLTSTEKSFKFLLFTLIILAPADNADSTYLSSCKSIFSNKKALDSIIPILSRTKLLPRCHLDLRTAVHFARYHHISDRLRRSTRYGILGVMPFTVPSAVHLISRLLLHSQQQKLSVSSYPIFISASSV